MTLVQVLVFCLLGLAVGRWGSRWRGWLLLVSSVLAIFWLQPGMPLRNMDFWFPAATLALTVLVWAVTRPAGQRGWSRADGAAALLMAALVLLIGLTRLFEPLCCLTATRPPPLLQIGLALLLTAAAAALLLSASQRLSWLPNLFVLLLLFLFVLLKSEPLAEQLSAGLRQLMQQDPTLASGFDIRWLGFSYVTFRLIHVLRDRVSGRLPEAGLAELVTFIIFFPAFTAGPIDRLQRFMPDLQVAFRLGSPELLQAGERIVWGIFKKFVIADSLALIALDARNADQIDQAGWMWVVLYAYTLLIYFDFSGYTDVAIGLGMLVGVRLPENFNRPYLQKNLTQFWNSWHITLALWFRAYYFNPLTRALRSRKSIPVQAIIFTGQFSTMVLIGLWHGLSWNFFLWGAWHGLGLFVHNRWSDRVRRRAAGENPSPHTARLLDWGGVLLTFHFVALGWVWFSLPAPDQALRVLGVLFGAGS
jgi:D-alanyl-lipoteichoic acid acyltransferase DltB (MBOAT superfamily)